MSSDESSEARLGVYVEALTGVIGHADRATPLRHYCTGLLMPAARKSVEPMAAMTAPARVAAQHQSLLHFVGQAPWSDTAVLTKVRDLVLPAIERAGPIEAWIIDDTGFPKKGRHSVGVARQYCGQLGKQDNSQVAVTLAFPNPTASLPIAYRLYLPQEWVDDPARRQKAGVPAAITFQTKPEIALDQLRAAAGAGLPRGVVLMASWTLAMAAIRSCAQTSPHSGSATWRGSCQTPRFGRRAVRRCPQALVGPGTTTQADAPGWRAPADLGEGAGAGSWAGGVDRALLARGRRRPSHLALRKGAGASRSSRLLAGRTAPAGMARDRVA